MRNLTLLVMMMVASAIIACALRLHAAAVWTPPTEPYLEQPAKIDFKTQIRPIFEARCQPCHFSGGKVYATMPFDCPQTVKRLGTKLFTRIKDEKEQQLIRQFLAEQ